MFGAERIITVELALRLPLSGIFGPDFRKIYRIYVEVEFLQVKLGPARIYIERPATKVTTLNEQFSGFSLPTFIERRIAGKEETHRVDLRLVMRYSEQYR